MNFLDIILNYFLNSGFITWIILIWLSVYFIFSLTIYFSRSIYLSNWLKKEQASLEAMLLGNKNPNTGSILSKCRDNGSSLSFLNVCKSVAEERATSGLHLLSIFASTSPFIGLFGTVVSILETFVKLGEGGNNSISVIAPAISEALVATGAGIFVAIPAYSFFILLKRKGYKIMNIVQRQIELIVSGNKI